MCPGWTRDTCEDVINDCSLTKGYWFADYLRMRLRSGSDWMGTNCEVKIEIRAQGVQDVAWIPLRVRSGIGCADSSSAALRT
jgi:hypothetical protein